MGRIFNKTDDDDETLGAEAVVEAIYGRQGIESIDEALLGEPVLRSIGEGVSATPFIEVPTYSNPAGVVVPSLYFELPDSPDDENAFTEFINALGIQNVADIDQLDGKLIPLVWEDGVPRPDLDEILN